jgi:hypothetical protein
MLVAAVNVYVIFLLKKKDFLEAINNNKEDCFNAES